MLYKKRRKGIKKFLLVLSAVMLFSGAAFADFNGPSAGFAGNQGFKGGANTSISTVKEVRGMYDDQIATVKGNITKRLSDDKYLFQDKTGEIVVEIDYKYWGGLQVDENDVLELTGKVDRDYNAVSLDVFIVKKAK